MSRQSEMVQRLRNVLANRDLPAIARAQITAAFRRFETCADNNYCRLQFCPRCALRKSTAAAKTLLGHVSCRVERLWYLTLARPGKAIASGWAALRRHWDNFRRTKLLREVCGGFVSREVTRGKGNWHTHLHSVVEVERPLDALALIDAWKARHGCEATQPAIESVRHPTKLTAYLVKREPWKWLAYDDRDLLAIVDAHIGPHLQRFFGSWSRK